MAPGSIRGSSGGRLYRACSSEGQERGRGQSKERGQKVEDCGGEEEEEEVRVYPMTPE